MAGWQDAPIVTPGAGGGKPAWMSAPVVVAQDSPASPLDQLPPETGGGNQPAAKNADDIAHRILGIGEAGLSAATGAAGGLAGQVYGIGKTLASGKFGTQAGIQEGEKAGVDLANKLTYQPRTQTGQNLIEGAGKLGEASRLQGLPVEAGTLGRIGEVPRGALATGEGAANIAGKGAAAVGSAASKVASKALPEVDPATAALARDAHAMGFRLTPDQVVGGKYAKAIGEGAANLPLSGSNLKYNREVFTQNVAKLAGVEGDKLTRKAFGDATKKVGSGIGELNNKYDLPIDRSFVPQLRTEARGQSPEVANAVNYFAGRIAKETQGGNLNGTTFRRINTELNNRIKATSNGDLKYALGNMQDKLLDLQQAQMSPADKTALQGLRRQYAIQRTIEPLIAKSPTGEIAPSALLGAITSTKAGKAAAARGAAGDLGKLADIGQRFLKENPSSGTAERSWAQGIPSALGGLAGGTAGVAGAGLGAAAGIGATIGAANLYNRFGPSITNRLIAAPPTP
jgi:hypothetical protein